MASVGVGTRTWAWALFAEQKVSNDLTEAEGGMFKYTLTLGHLYIPCDVIFEGKPLKPLRTAAKDIRPPSHSHPVTRSRYRCNGSRALPILMWTRWNSIIRPPVDRHCITYCCTMIQIMHSLLRILRGSSSLFLHWALRMNQPSLKAFYHYVHIDFP